jgi:hypothetical protein
MPAEFARPAGASLRLHFHRGQWRAWESDARFVAVIAGTQSGKTEFGPPWLLREIQRRGPGDYLVVAPTYPLLSLKALPAFLRLFEEQMRLGKYVGSPTRKFTFSRAACRRLFGKGSRAAAVYFGHASDPDSLESATAKAAWPDECGQGKFRLASWEALLRRLAIHRGRALLTTTPYNLGWLKQQVYDRWKAGDPDYEVVNFESTANPAFPREEFEDARAKLPPWKFNLYYRGLFTRPAGLIYDAFDEAAHKAKRSPVPPAWPRFLGLDFGGVNTAGVFYARRPDGVHVAYREYKAGGRAARDHVRELLKGEPRVPYCCGGSHSEGQWRQEFRAAGLPVHEPAVRDVEVGIDRVYGLHRRGLLLVFDDLKGYLEEKLTYSRVVNERGEPTEAIDDKNAFHFMDAERYICSRLAAPPAGAPSAGGRPVPRGPEDGPGAFA